MKLDPNFISNTNVYEIIKDTVTCIVCLNILYNPMQCSICGHSFCKECLDEWLRNNRVCPMYKCKKPSYTKINLTLINNLNKLEFICIQGCNKIISYSDLSSHELKCENLLVNCLCCGTKNVLINQLQNQKIKELDTCESEIKKIREQNFLLNENSRIAKQQLDEVNKNYKALKEENKILKEDYKKLSNNEVFRKIVKVLPGTSNILVYDYLLKEKKTISIYFSIVFGEDKFNHGSATILYKNFLYITGGFFVDNISNKIIISSNFYAISTETYKMVRMKNMSKERKNHGIIAHDNFIYIVGGDDETSVEKYDLINDCWIALPSVKKGKNNQRPILGIYNNFLLSFIELENEEKLVIEKMDLKKKSRWKALSASLPFKFNEIGTIHLNNELYFIGENQKNRFIWSFNFSQNYFKWRPIVIVGSEGLLDERWTFRGEKLYYLGMKYYGQFNDSQEFINNKFINQDVALINLD